MFFLFQLYDFNDDGAIFHEYVAVMLIHVSKALKVVTGLGEVVAEKDARKLCDLSFSPGQFVEQEDFLKFVRQKIFYLENDNGDTTGVQPYMTDYFKILGIPNVPYPEGVTFSTVKRSSQETQNLISHRGQKAATPTSTE